MRFHVISLFPQSLDSYIHESIIGRAEKEGKIKFFFYNPRDFVKMPASQKGKDKPYLRVDNKPYGGGPGMVIEAMPIIKAIEAANKKATQKAKAKVKIIFFSPAGKLFNTVSAKKISKNYTDVILVCGRYEGIDARVKKVFKMDDVSIGDFVVTGGELPAMILIDTISRQIKGVLGDFSSREEERVASSDVYTRPEEFAYKGKKYKVPKVLLSGHHKKIDEWRRKRES